VNVTVASATWSGVTGLETQVQVTHAGLGTNSVTLQSFRTED
jgi:hypothetical protein